MNRSHGVAYLEISIAAVILSFSGVLARFANLPSGAMTFVRTAVPTLILGTWLLLKRGGHRRFSWWLPVASLLNALRILLFFEAYRLTSLGNAVIVLYTWPAIAIVFAALIQKESFTSRDLLLVALAFAGMVIVYSGADFSLQDQDFLGMSLMLCSALIYALSLVLIRRENIDRLNATLWQNLAGAILFLPSFIAALGTQPLESWAWAVTNGVFVGTIAFALVFSAFSVLPAAIVGHISYLEVVFALIWGVLIFDEPTSWRHLVGGGLIVLSMIIRAELLRRQRSVIMVKPKT